jgi:predicted nucleic acid-binding protein
VKVLLDTNVLCRVAERGHPDHAIATSVIDKLRAEGNQLCLVPQVLYEYWVVVTRPVSDNGLGMTAVDADAVIDLWLELFTLFRDERGVFTLWRGLVKQHDAKGKSAYDARLVAAMKRHRISHMVTFNVADFRRYREIEIIDARAAAVSS